MGNSAGPLKSDLTELLYAVREPSFGAGVVQMWCGLCGCSHDLQAAVDHDIGTCIILLMRRPSDSGPSWPTGTTAGPTGSIRV